MRRLLMQLVAVLSAVPFVAGWIAGLHHITSNSQSMAVVTFATFVRWPGALLGLPFIVTWVAAPLVFRLRRFPSKPQLVPFDPRRHALPNDAVRWLDENVAVLTLEGFDLLAAYVHERDDAKVYYRLLEHREQRIIAQVLWTASGSWLTLCTTTARGVRLTTVANGLVVMLPEPASYVREYFPGLGAQNLVRVHRALVEADGGPIDAGYRDGLGDLRADPLAWATRLEASLTAARCADGILTPAARDGNHRVRWRAAAICQWSALWPIYARADQRRVRRARELLAKHGFAFPVVQGKHGKQAFQRLVAGPAGGLSAVLMIGLSAYALFVPRTHDAPLLDFSAIQKHTCPCEVASPPEDTSLALFGHHANFVAAGRRLPASTQRIELPDALLIPHARPEDVSAIRASDGKVIAPDARALLSLECIAATPEDARVIERELRDYVDARGLVALAPWIAAPTAEQTRARRTLRLAQNHLEDTAAPGDLDDRVVRLYANRPSPADTSANEAWRLHMGELLGGAPPPPIGQSVANVFVQGVELRLGISGTVNPPRELIAAARYLCAKGCRNVRYDVTSYSR